MLCHKAVPWLLAAHSDEDLPGDLSAHLRSCPACRALHGRLGAIDASVRSVARPMTTAALDRLSDALDGAPQTAVRIASPNRRKGKFRRWVTAGTAAATLLTIGWASGRFVTKGRLDRVEAAPTPSTSPGPAPVIRPDPLIVRVAGPGSKLSYAPGQAERIDALKAMADEVRSEAIQLASVGSTEEALRLTGVHDTLLRQGVSGRILALPPAERAPVAARLVLDLRTDEASILAAEQRMPEPVVGAIRPFRDCVAAVAADIEADRASKPAAAEPGTGRLEALTALALRLAETDAPMRRAELSVEMANALAASTVLVAIGTDDRAVEKLSGYMDAVLIRGIGENLDRAEAEDPDGKLREPIAGVRAKSGQSITVLERSASQAPPQARKGLEKAAQASRAGLDRASQNGKGPPWKRSDGNWVPPGQQKKP